MKVHLQSKKFSKFYNMGLAGQTFCFTNNLYLWNIKKELWLRPWDLVQRPILITQSNFEHSTEKICMQQKCKNFAYNIWVVLMVGLLYKFHWLSAFKYICCLIIIKVREIKFPFLANSCNKNSLILDCFRDTGYRLKRGIGWPRPNLQFSEMILAILLSSSTRWDYRNDSILTV